MQNLMIGMPSVHHRFSRVPLTISMGYHVWLGYIRSCRRFNAVPGDAKREVIGGR